ncbi:MAG TPA: hypothetical protein PK264_20985 [Hyphomicrobiaceae bacterium]|nr:hypothetical protein [Hyphomicrobiaceae bacterium]
MSGNAIDIDKLLTALTPERRELMRPLIGRLNELDDAVVAEALLSLLSREFSAQDEGAKALAEVQRSGGSILAIRETHRELATELASKLLNRASLIAENVKRLNDADAPRAPQATAKPSDSEGVTAPHRQPAPTEASSPTDTRMNSTLRNYWFLVRLEKANAPIARAVLTSEVMQRGFSPNGDNAAATALARLVKDGYLTRPRDGYFSITDLGRKHIAELKAKIEETGGDVPTVPSA